MMKALFTTSLLLVFGFTSAQAGTLTLFRTAFGTIEVELYDNEKPVTTANFKRLVEAGAYHNTIIHRLVPGFVAQGGSYYSFNAGSTNLFAPPWSQLGGVSNFGPITNEFSFGPLLSNTNGTLAMAKVEGNPNSATSGWFFNLVNNASTLDSQNGGFTVFGRVTRDPNNVLGILNTRSYGNNLVSMSAWYPSDFLATNAFTTLPVLYPGTAQPRYVDLLHVDILLLALSIQYTNTQAQISWPVVGGKTNVVEMTESFPPNWQPIFSTVPAGGNITLIDNTGGARRFYRLRVVY